jgi:hypothetical protein
MSESYEAAQRLRVVIPGGSGHVGKVLARHLQERGHFVSVLTRGPYTAQWETVHWDGMQIGPWTETLEGADVCINLAGRSVSCRYSAEHRREIYESRIGTTRLLNRAIAQMERPPRVWLNASTVAIYGDDDRSGSDELGDGLREGANVATRRKLGAREFLRHVARDWEAALFETPTPRTRKVAMRSAMAMRATAGGAFATLLNLVRVGLGGQQGNGRQFVSWIHEEDFARAVEFLIARDEMEGAVNIAAPIPLPNREFMEELREAWGMPNGVPAPRPLLEIAAFVLRTEPTLLLKSSRAVPARLMDAGFRFEFPEWREAAEDLVRRWKSSY